MLIWMKNWLYHIRLHQVVLGIIVLIGLWLRLNNLSQTIWFFDGMDEARDVLVAKHIVEYGEVIWRGPFAAGGYFWLQNSPLYYYFLAVIWFFGRSAAGSIIIWTVISTTGILLSYWAGKLTRNRTTGLVAAGLYALHPSLILAGTQIMQPHLLPLTALLFYCATLSAWKEKATSWLLWASFWLLLPIHFHYGSVLLWPIGGLALVVSWYVAIKQKWQDWLTYLCYSLLLSFNIALFWLLFTYKYEFFDQFYFFTLNKYTVALPLLVKLSETATNFKNLTLSYVPDWVGFFVIGGFVMNWLLNRKNPAHYFALALLLSAGFSLVFKNYIAATYLLGLLPFWILLWADSIVSSFTKYWWLGILVVLLTGWWWRDMSRLAKSNLPEQSFYLQTQTAADTIYQDYLTQAARSSTELPRFTVAELASYTGIQYDGWRVGSFWFHLEKLTQQKLVKLTDWDTNFYPLSETFDFVYLVCDRRDLPEKAYRMCYEAFTQRRNYLDAGQIIYDKGAFLIWRFRIDQTKRPDQIYQVYQEYM